jgi:lysozyme family protein
MELTQYLKDEYISLWKSCEIKPAYESALNDSVDIIKSNKDRYIKVSDETGVPWYLIAIIHGMEGSFNFRTHLHNGDPLTAPTINVPAGRPREGFPPFKWEESAVDALHYDEATGIQSWDLPTIVWFLEGFNGWGYRTGAGRNTTPKERSAYIYSGTIHYEKGKYVEDGSFDPDFASNQVGCMAQLFGLAKEGLVDFSSSVSPVIENDQNKVGSVAAWQNILNGSGYYPTLFITGVLDAETVEMTKKFQRNLGLLDSGAVNLKTWKVGLKHRKIPGWSNITPPISVKNRLNLLGLNFLDSGLNSNIIGSVATWQHILNGCGHRPLLPLSGYMDGATVESTKRFQKDLSLSESGTVTLDTWRAGLNHRKLPGWSPSLPSSITQRLYNFYSKRENYEAVYDNVMGWYGKTSQGCVAFLSSALRLSGYEVPKTTPSDGDVSLVTTDFSEYLVKENWKKFDKENNLQAGDVVFTIPDAASDYPNDSAHVYMFAGWNDESGRIAWVIDNQGFTHQRNILAGGGGFNFTPFWYFLRA